MKNLKACSRQRTRPRQPPRHPLISCGWRHTAGGPSACWPAWRAGDDLGGYGRSEREDRRRRRHKCARYDHRRAHRRSLIQLAVSRSGEYQATPPARTPQAILRARQRPGKSSTPNSRRVPMQASPSTAHLFIIQPFLGMNFGSLFSTHRPSRNESSGSREGRRVYAVRQTAS